MDVNQSSTVHYTANKCKAGSLISSLSRGDPGDYRKSKMEQVEALGFREGSSS